MYVSVAGLPNDQLPAGGQKFVKDFSAANGGTAPDPYAVYAAQAADVMLSAIGSSDGTRAGVASSLFKVNIPSGILGHVSFNPNGDVNANPVTIYQVVHGKSSVHKVIVPATSLVTAA
jgi:ABC-type branched-subunit amino acid transport system substrate-binding protein